MTRLLAFGLLAGLLTQPRALAVENGTPAAVGWMTTGLDDEASAQRAAESASQTLQTLSVRLVDFAEIESFLKELDQRKGILDEAGKLLKRGKEFSLGLKLPQAIKTFNRAIDKLAQGFVRYYDPGLVAGPVLELGVALFESGQVDKARLAFVRAVRLAPRLSLAEGYYSPSVRKAFDKARAELGSVRPDLPDPKEAGRLCRAAGLKCLVVASLEHLGDRSVLRLSAYDAGGGTFTAVSTAVINDADPARAGEDAASRLLTAVAAAAGITFVPPSSVDGGVVAADAEPSDPWYRRHWWIWPVCAAIVSVAVTLPLTVFREDVVDLRVRF